MTLAANASQLQTPLLGDFPAEADAVESWATAMVAYFKGMTRLPGTDPILDALKPSIKAALTGMATHTPPLGASKFQGGFAAAWAGISVNAASLFAGAASATPPPTVATIASAILPGVFAANNVVGVTRPVAASVTATALSGANATGGLWVLAAGGTAPIT